VSSLRKLATRHFPKSVFVSFYDFDTSTFFQYALSRYHVMEWSWVLERTKVDSDLFALHN
jgi:hypothetical protein